MRPITLLLFCILSCLAIYAQDSVRSEINWHFQTTYIYQYKPEFSASYSGENSLQTKFETQNSLTSTMYIGAKLWKGAEIYINPEVAGGSGLSGAYGMAASTNGETFRIGDPAPTLYLARTYIRQTIGFNAPTDTIPNGINQLGIIYPTRSISFYLGKFSLNDLIDNNTFSGSPRTQFINWCLMANGAWDYAADLRGYTYSFATVLRMENTSYKVALATLPVSANGIDLNTNLGQEYSINTEVSRSYKWKHQDGHWRLLGYYNNGHMGNYTDAIEHAAPGGVPYLIGTRKYGRDKYGFGLNMDQQLNDIAGVFMRVGWNDGQNETWCFTEADHSLSGGLSLNGSKWKRKDDVFAIALVVNDLSKNHKNYIADGGLGFQIGDGRLNYGLETVTELYYAFKPTSNTLWITGDYQFALNPGYNKDRGPVSVLSLRVHVEF